ncbi:translation initiation factor IF-2-like [Corvus hawaiiensis]|uniref:translation initiation factor IF-2-like n=1 Tax=Corvus hawaiiensis TaxID=134902 RepID=UPI0020188A46|nr:translation initiation factor IF-2-like [Corvus hawaiiensis]
MAQPDPQRYRDAARSGSGQSSTPTGGRALSAGHSSARWRDGSSVACPGHGGGDPRPSGASPAFPRSASPTLREGCQPATRRARGHPHCPGGVYLATGPPGSRRGRHCQGTSLSAARSRAKRRGEARCPRPPCRRRSAAIPRGPGERRSAVPPPLSSLPSPQLRPGHRHTPAGQGGSAEGQRPPRHYRDAVPPPPGTDRRANAAVRRIGARGLPGATVPPRPAPAALTVRAAPGAAPSGSGATGVGPRPPPGPWGGRGGHVTGTGRGAPGAGPAPRDTGAAPTPRFLGRHVAPAPLPPPAPVTWRPLPRRHDGGGRRGQ